jgi:hypothetical protein
VLQLIELSLQRPICSELNAGHARARTEVCRTASFVRTVAPRATAAARTRPPALTPPCTQRCIGSSFRSRLLDRTKYRSNSSLSYRGYAPDNGVIGTCSTSMAHLAACTVTCNTGYTAVTATAVPTASPTPAPTPHSHHSHHSHHNHFWGRRRLLESGNLATSKQPSAAGRRSAAKDSSLRNAVHSHAPGFARPLTGQAAAQNARKGRTLALDEAGAHTALQPAFGNGTAQPPTDPFFDIDPIESSSAAPAPDPSLEPASAMPPAIAAIFRRRGQTGNR